MPAFKDTGGFPSRDQRPSVKRARIKLVLTTAGAVDTTNTKYPYPSGYSVTKPTGTGVYDVVFPPMPKAPEVIAYVQKSASADVVACFGLTAPTAAGAWQFQAWKAAAANPGSGDVIIIEVIGEEESLGY